jgi:DhnA family fructose-bisphosphate aldolase class Ia
VEPLVLLAADHRARGVITIEAYGAYVAALEAALPHCDGVLASAQPLADLAKAAAGKRTYLSINRTGLAGSTFELDDRLVAPVKLAGDLGYTGIKHMTRIDRSDPYTPAGLELLGEVLAEARSLGIDALIEPLSWSGGVIDRTTDAIVYAAVIAHDLGAPLVKVPVPGDAAPGRARAAAARRVVESVGVPVLFLGGPRTDDRSALLAEVADAMDGGGAGMAIGRAVYQDPDPAGMAELVGALVRGERDLVDVAAAAQSLPR